MDFTAAGFSSWMQDTLGQFGIKGQLAILFIVFFVDSVLFPMLPEAFVLYFYNIIPRVETRFSERTDLFLTAAMLLMVVLAAEMAANGFLYSLVKWKRDRLPKRLTRAMNKWREFLVVSDERVVLINRIVPVMPFTGAFIAVSPWKPRKAMGYLLLGGALKYGALITVVGVAGLYFLDPRQTLWLSLGLIVGIVAVSAASSGLLRRRMQARAAAAAALPPAPAEGPLTPEQER